MRLREVGRALAASAIAFTMTACTANQKPDPSDKVTAALKDANLKDVDVNYDRSERVVHLKGTVDSTAERTRAEQVAERAVGTSGKVLNEVTVKGVDTKTADDNDGRIKDRLKDMIANDPGLSKHDISFSVNNGAVEVTGSVAQESEKSKVTQMVRSVDGVRDVANALKVTPDAKKDDTSDRPR
jgi:hyperosmotically inducible periplasmic protein